MIGMRGYYAVPNKMGLADGAERNDNDLPTHTVNTIICWMQVCQTALAVVAELPPSSSKAGAAPFK